MGQFRKSWGKKLFTLYFKKNVKTTPLITRLSIFTWLFSFILQFLWNVMLDVMQVFATNYSLVVMPAYCMYTQIPGKIKNVSRTLQVAENPLN